MLAIRGYNREIHARQTGQSSAAGINFMPHSSVTSIVAQLRDQYPSAPFLALGQTVLWDEPVKAAWRLILDQLWPDAYLVAGVHDTDYFAKSTALVSTDDPYALLAHNDGATRGLWSAAGEMSTFPR